MCFSWLWVAFKGDCWLMSRLGKNFNIGFVLETIIKLNLSCFAQWLPPLSFTLSHLFWFKTLIKFQGHSGVRKLKFCVFLTSSCLVEFKLCMMVTSIEEICIFISSNFKVTSKYESYNENSIFLFWMRVYWAFVLLAKLFFSSHVYVLGKMVWMFEWTDWCLSL